MWKNIKHKTFLLTILNNISIYNSAALIASILLCNHHNYFKNFFKNSQTDNSVVDKTLLRSSNPTWKKTNFDSQSQCYKVCYVLLHIYIHSECFLSPITGTLMALKKVRAKGENDMSVLVGSCNYEAPESLHTPISRFQLTFKLSQMAFKKYPLPIGEFWSFWLLYPHILLRKWLENWYGHPCWERTHMSLDTPSGFVHFS